MTKCFWCITLFQSHLLVVPHTNRKRDDPLNGENNTSTSWPMVIVQWLAKFALDHQLQSSIPAPYKLSSREPAALKSVVQSSIQYTICYCEARLKRSKEEKPCIQRDSNQTGTCLYSRDTTSAIIATKHGKQTQKVVQSYGRIILLQRPFQGFNFFACFHLLVLFLR